MPGILLCAFLLLCTGRAVAADLLAFTPNGLPEPLMCSFQNTSGCVTPKAMKVAMKTDKEVPPPGPLFYQALELVAEDAAAADALFRQDATPLSLCYCAWLREQNVLEPADENDTALALLDRAREALPEPEGGWQDSPEDWPDAPTPLMGKILSTMFFINSRALHLQSSSLPRPL